MIIFQPAYFPLTVQFVLYDFSSFFCSCILDCLNYSIFLFVSSCSARTVCLCESVCMVCEHRWRVLVTKQCHTMGFFEGFKCSLFLQSCHILMDTQYFHLASIMSWFWDNSLLYQLGWQGTDFILFQFVLLCPHSHTGSGSSRIQHCHICHENQGSIPGGSALPLFAECFELGDDSVRFSPMETSWGWGQNCSFWFVPNSFICLFFK